MLCPPHSHQTHPIAISNSPNRFFRERPSHRATHHTRFCARARWCACAYMCVQPNAASSLSHALRPNGPAARRASRTAQRASAHQRHYFARPCMCVSACRRVRERARVYAFVVNQKRVACCGRGVVAFLWLWLCVAEFQFTRLYFLLPVRLCCVEAWAFRLLYGAIPRTNKSIQHHTKDVPTLVERTPLACALNRKSAESAGTTICCGGGNLLASPATAIYRITHLC